MLSNKLHPTGELVFVASIYGLLLTLTNVYWDEAPMLFVFGFDLLNIRGHTKVKVYLEYHHVINGYWVVDNLGDSWSKMIPIHYPCEEAGNSINMGVYTK